MANYFYTDSSGPDVDALKLALAKLKQLATGGTAGLFLTQKANLDGSVLDDVVTSAVTKQMKTHGTATWNGVTLVSLFATTSAISFKSGPILALYVHARALSQVVATGQDIIYVPWMEAELAEALKNGLSWTKL